MSKLLLLLLFIVLTSCAQWVRVPASFESVSEKHLVFDIDWTITSEVAPGFKGKRIIEVEGKKYFVHDGIEDFIENILQKKDIKISFFSGGSFERNHQLLKNIVLKDGRSLEDIAYKILNREDLSLVPSAKPTDKFSLRYKKDLTKISTDLNNLVMLDDTEHFTLNAAQDEHVVYLGKTYEHFEKFSDAKLATGEYVPRSGGEWRFAKEKLIILQGVINQAYSDMPKTNSNFFEAVKAIEPNLNLMSGDWSEYSQKMYTRAVSCQHLIKAFF